MTPDDLDAVAAIEAQACAGPWTRGQLADSLAAGHVARVVAHPGAGEGPEAIQGYYVAMQGVDECHLLNIVVAPPHQGRGLGARLMADFEAMARARGLATLWLEVRVGNPRARRLYERRGYQVRGLRRGYYAAAEGVREDALVMSRAAHVDADADGDAAAAGSASGVSDALD